jgi:hypothetical protein
MQDRLDYTLAQRSQLSGAMRRVLGAHRYAGLQPYNGIGADCYCGRYPFKYSPGSCGKLTACVFTHPTSERRRSGARETRRDRGGPRRGGSAASARPSGRRVECLEAGSSASARIASSRAAAGAGTVAGTRAFSVSPSATSASSPWRVVAGGARASCIPPTAQLVDSIDVGHCTSTLEPCTSIYRPFLNTETDQDNPGVFGRSSAGDFSRPSAISIS